jgi:hypothetical protein
MSISDVDPKGIAHLLELTSAGFSAGPHIALFPRQLPICVVSIALIENVHLGAGG